MITAILLGLLLWAQPAHAAWTVTSASAHGAGSPTTCDVSISTTGGNVITLLVAAYGDSQSVANISETGASNSWTKGGSSASSADGQQSVGLYYVLSPSTSGSHHIKYTGNYPGCIVFVGAQGAATSVDGTVKTNGTLGGGGGSIQAGSLGASGDLVIEGVGYYSANAGNTIDSSFATPVQVDYLSGNYEGTLGSYLEVSGSVNPTWSFSPAQTAVGSIAIAFTGGGGAAAACRGTLSTLGVSICGVH